MVFIPEDCPGCRVLAEVMKESADRLSNFAGGVVGSAIGARRGKPMEGALIGSAIAPHLIESGALAIRDFVKPKRKQSKGQKTRAKKMSKAMKKASSMGRLKSGKYRKGWDAKKIMKTANRLCK